jgi:hypothetical protein
MARLASVLGFMSRSWGLGLAATTVGYSQREAGQVSGVLAGEDGRRRVTRAQEQAHRPGRASEALRFPLGIPAWAQRVSCSRCGSKWASQLQAYKSAPAPVYARHAAGRLQRCASARILLGQRRLQHTVFDHSSHIASPTIQ